MTKQTQLGGTFNFPGTTLAVHRVGYGAMQLAGRDGNKMVWGPPADVPGAIAVLREAIASGVDHIDTSDFYGPHITNQLIKQALHPYPDNLKLAKPNAIVMHPGPINRGVEMSSYVVDGPQSCILKQVENGVAVRMSMLYHVSGGEMAAE